MKYLVWDIERETMGDAKIVDASSPYEAAHKWAKENDEECNNCFIAGGDNSPIVNVLPSDGGESKNFRIYGDLQPVYSVYAHSKAVND